MKAHAIASACTGLAAALAPKCPLCIAAWLSAFGIGTGIGGALALLLGPTLWGLALLLAAAALLRWSRRYRRMRRSTISPSFSTGKNDAKAKPSSG